MREFPPIDVREIAAPMKDGRAIDRRLNGPPVHVVIAERDAGWPLWLKLFVAAAFIVSVAVVVTQ